MEKRIVTVFVTVLEPIAALFAGSAGLGREVLSEHCACIRQILVCGDIVPIEDVACLVSADRHGKIFGDSGAHHIPHGATPEVME